MIATMNAISVAQKLATTAIMVFAIIATRSIKMSEQIELFPDIIVENFYPDTDAVTISESSGNWSVTVWKDERSETHILVSDNRDSTQMNLVLGQDGFTQRC